MSCGNGEYPTYSDYEVGSGNTSNIKTYMRLPNGKDVPLSGDLFCYNLITIGAEFDWIEEIDTDLHK